MQMTGPLRYLQHHGSVPKSRWALVRSCFFTHFTLVPQVLFYGSLAVTQGHNAGYSPKPKQPRASDLLLRPPGARVYYYRITQGTNKAKGNPTPAVRSKPSVSSERKNSCRRSHKPLHIQDIATPPSSLRWCRETFGKLNRQAPGKGISRFIGNCCRIIGSLLQTL